MKTSALATVAALALLGLLVWAFDRGQGRSLGESPEILEGEIEPKPWAAADRGVGPQDQTGGEVVPGRTPLAEDGLSDALMDPLLPVELEVKVIDRRSRLPIKGAVLSTGSGVGSVRPFHGFEGFDVSQVDGSQVIVDIDFPHGIGNFEGSDPTRRGTQVSTGSDGKAVIEVGAQYRLTVTATGYVEAALKVPVEWVSGEAQEGGSTAALIELNEHAALFGSIGSPGISVPKGAVVTIEQRIEGEPQIQGARVSVKSDGTWQVDPIEIAHGAPSARGLFVFAMEGSSTRLLAEGLTLRPGERTEVHDVHGADPPWGLNLVYGDGSPMGPGAKVLLRETGARKDSFLWASTTDAGGRLQVRGVGDGTFGLLVSFVGREFSGQLRRAGKAPEQDFVLEGYGRVAGRVLWDRERPITAGGDLWLIGLGGETLGSQPFRGGRFRFDLVPMQTRCQLILPVLPGKAGGRWSGRVKPLGDALLRPLTTEENRRLRSSRSRPFVKDVIPSFEDIEFSVTAPGK